MKRRILRIGPWIGGPVLALVAIAAGLGHAFTAKFNPDPPNADYAHPATALEAQRQDIDYFGKLTALDRGHFRVAPTKIAALADNGHTSFNSKKPSRATILPIRLATFPEGSRVLDRAFVLAKK